MADLPTAQDFDDSAELLGRVLRQAARAWAQGDLETAEEMAAAAFAIQDNDEPGSKD